MHTCLAFLSSLRSACSCVFFFLLNKPCRLLPLPLPLHMPLPLPTHESPTHHPLVFSQRLVSLLFLYPSLLTNPIETRRSDVSKRRVSACRSKRVGEMYPRVCRRDVPRRDVPTRCAEETCLKNIASALQVLTHPRFHAFQGTGP